ncbi:hypothetical protein Tco_1213647 [Tanacetum coccineum]
MERFKNAILQQRDEINNRMGEMFGLLKELIASRASKKEEKTVEYNGSVDKGIVEPRKSDEEEPPKEVNMKNEVERKADDKPAKSTEENVRRMKRMSQQELLSSSLEYYLKTKSIEKLIEGLFENHRLEEDKARRHGKVYNWGTATYSRNWYDDDVYELRSVETEFPAIVFNDTLTSEVALSCEPMVSSLDDNKIDFRISFDESDDENYTLFNDLDYLKDFENEFPAIVYNDALTSKLDFLTEPSINPQHIDEFNFKYDTSFSKCGGEEENILYFNDLFPFNIIYPDDLKSDQDNDDKKN